VLLHTATQILRHDTDRLAGESLVVTTRTGVSDSRGGRSQFPRKGHTDRSMFGPSSGQSVGVKRTGLVQGRIVGT
jgi:hypothetical protein